MITTSNSPAKGSGTPNRYDGDLPHTMGISGVSDRVVIQTLVNKYCSHLPLYRQSVRLEQETGVELSRATMDGWVMQVGPLLMPVVGAMKKELLGGSYLQADETPVAVQMHDRRGHGRMLEQSYDPIVPMKVGNRRAPARGGHGTRWREGGSRRTNLLKGNIARH